MRNDRKKKTLMCCKGCYYSYISSWSVLKYKPYLVKPKTMPFFLKYCEAVI